MMAGGGEIVPRAAPGMHAIDRTPNPLAQQLRNR